MPWAARAAQLQQVRERIGAMQTDPSSALFSGLTSVDFDKAFEAAGALKTWEYLLLAGPVGKYTLQGVFHEEQQSAMFR